MNVLYWEPTEVRKRCRLTTLMYFPFLDFGGEIERPIASVSDFWRLGLIAFPQNTFFLREMFHIEPFFPRLGRSRRIQPQFSIGAAGLRSHSDSPLRAAQSDEIAARV